MDDKRTFQFCMKRILTLKILNMATMGNLKLCWEN